MPVYGGSVAGGYSDGLKAVQDREKTAAMLKAYLQQQEQQKTLFDQQQQGVQRAHQARAGAGNAFLDQFGAPPGNVAAPTGPAPGQPAPQPPMPGQAEGPSAPPVQMGPPPQNPMQPGPGASVMAGAPGTTPPAAMNPSWQPMPSAGGGQGAPQADGAIPPPPKPPEQPKPGQLASSDIASFAKRWKEEGLSGEQIMDQLELLTPILSARQKTELEQLKFGLDVQTRINAAQEKIIADARAERTAQETGRHNLAMEGNQGDARQPEIVKELRAMGIDPQSPEGKKAIQDNINKKNAPSRTTVNVGGASDFGGKNGDLMAALAERGVSLPAGFRSKQQQTALLAGLLKRNPDLTSDQIADKVASGQLDLNAQRAESRTAGGIAGKVAYAEKEIEQIAPLVREASAKVPRGNFVPWNKLKLYGESQLSDPDLKELHSYLNTLSNAYDMLAARGGTDMEKRKENRKLLDSADSPQALERAIVAIEKEAKASGRAGKESMKSHFGKDDGGASDAGGIPAGWTVKEH